MPITALIVQASEMLAVVGNELALFATAAFIYLAFSTWSRRSGKLTRPQRSTSETPAFQGKTTKNNFAQSAKSAPPKATKDNAKITNAVEQRVRLACKTIRDCGKIGDLAAASKAFELTPAASRNRLLYNCFLDACVECGDLEKAASTLSSAEASGLADAVTYNTMMKGYLAAGKTAEAEGVITQLKSKGVQCTAVSYHGLMHARLQAGDQDGAWRLIAEMRAEGLSPTAVTCSILLKGVSSGSARASDTRRILDLIDGLPDTLDEVLLTSVVDTCTRSGHLHYLKKMMGRFEGCRLSTTAYGCMIKAFGQAHDIDQVWRTWRQMRRQQITPTEITLGCMIEALVKNRKADEAWQLVQDLWADESQRQLVNTVTYTTLLKGFARQPERVLELYEEMKARSLECNTITYNTILNAFAQIGDMSHVENLLEDMKKGGAAAEPDIVTYSTLIKGYVARGDLNQALGMFQTMKKEGNFTPDEMLYNTLLDGCSKDQRLTESLQLVDDMRSSGVTASNYTLSMLVKLLGRCRKLGQAFSMVDKLANENGFKPNIQVYTCLIMACFHNKQPRKALAVLDRLLSEGLQPDERVFTALVKGFLQAGDVARAVQVVERAYEKNSSTRPAVGVEARSLEEVVSKIGGSRSPEGSKLMAKVSSVRRGAKSVGGGAHSNAPWRKKLLEEELADASTSDGTCSNVESGAASSDSDSS